MSEFLKRVNKARAEQKEAYIDMLDELFADYILEADKAKTGYSYMAIAMGR